MKLIIAGSRSINPSMDKILHHLMQFKLVPTEIVCGGCVGVDTAGAQLALNYNLPIRYFYPNWDKWGLKAGPYRNEEMAHYGDALLLFWDGKSRGSASMKREMEKLKKPVYLVRYYSEGGTLDGN